MVPEALRRLLAPGDGSRLAILLSGGVDSSVLLAAAAATLGPESILGITVVSPLIPESDIMSALKLCSDLGVDHEILRLDLLEVPGLRQNGPDRCHLCKRAMCGAALELAASRGFTRLADGTNADDLREKRTGLSAIAEAGVESPLAASGLSRREVRDLGTSLAIEGVSRPSQSCLATRIAAGRRLAGDILSFVDRMEREIRKLAKGGFRIRLGLEEDAEVRFSVEDSELVEQYRDWLLEQMMGRGITLIRFTAVDGRDTRPGEGRDGPSG